MRSFIFSFLAIAIFYTNSNSQINVISQVTTNIPEVLNYQGYATDSSKKAIPDGNYDFTFSIYDIFSGGAPLWTEQHPSVPVTSGLFQVVLGKGTPPVPLSLPFDQQYYLGVKLGNNSEMTPRLALAATAYSFRSKISESVIDNAITSSKLAPNSVTDDKIVTVNYSKIMNAPQSLPPKGPAGGDLSGTYPNPQIADGAVTNTKIFTSGASPKDVLTYNGSTVIWSPIPGGGGFVLPFSGTTSDPVPGFKVDKTGGSGAAINGVSSGSDANAGKFSITNSGNSQSALYAETNGFGSAIYAKGSSTTKPVLYSESNTAQPAIEAKNLLTGPAAVGIDVRDGSGTITTTLYANGNINTAGSITTASTITASGDISTTSNVSAGNTISATGDISTASNVSAANNISATNTITAGSHITAGGKVHATEQLETAKVLGSGSTPGAGAVYSDNIIGAWGLVSRDAQLTNGFGVSGVSGWTQSSGTYIVTLTSSYPSASSYVVTATARASSIGWSFYCDVDVLSGNSFKVRTYRPTGSGAFQDDMAFQFIVVGRK